MFCNDLFTWGQDYDGCVLIVCYSGPALSTPRFCGSKILHKLYVVLARVSSFSFDIRVLGWPCGEHDPYVPPSACVRCIRAGFFPHYSTKSNIIFLCIDSSVRAPPRDALQRRQIAAVIRSDVHPPRGRAPVEKRSSLFCRSVRGMKGARALIRHRRT